MPVKYLNTTQEKYFPCSWRQEVAVVVQLVLKCLLNPTWFVLAVYCKSCKKGGNEGEEEKEQKIVACEELSILWEVLGVPLMGLAVFGEKVVERLIFICGCSDMRVFLLCACEYMCAHVTGGERAGSGCCLFLSCLFSIQFCGLQRRMLCEGTVLLYLPVCIYSSYLCRHACRCVYFHIRVCFRLWMRMKCFP